MPEASSTFEEAVEALYGLNIGVVGTGAERHERPHKPLLMLAVLDLIAQGRATPDKIAWSQALRDRFAFYFPHVQRRDDQDTPENPFFYLRQEGWWQPLRVRDGVSTPLESTPTVGDARAGTVFARIVSPVSAWMILPTDRLRLRDALIARFFPQARAALTALFLENISQESAPPQDDNGSDAEPRPGRSAGFRRTILDIYDCQCAACGLRIKLPQIDDLTFVDAAHLIPFSDPELGGNDHPTNGIALCKNHHWAMDRFLIAPTPEGNWQVSRFLDARRSLGEAELHALKEKPILLPQDEAFHPASNALAWRTSRLAA